MSNLIIHNLVFWPVWALISMAPYWIMQRIIDKGAALSKANRR